MATPASPLTKPGAANGDASAAAAAADGRSYARRLESSLKEALDAMTVEPAFALYCVAETASKFVHQAFLLSKVAFADWAHEPPRSATSNATDQAVKWVTFANSWLITPAVFVTVFYTVLAISWSDKVGRRRRPLLLAPASGLVLECALATLHAYFWRWSVGWALATYALAQVLSGGRICFAQCTYLYVADITTAENRTARYGVLMTVRYFAMPLGYALGGFLLQYVGFFYAFLVAFALSLAALLLVCALVPDVAHPPQPFRRPLGFWRAISLADSLRSLRVLLKKRPQNNRLILAAAVLAYTLFSFTNEGKSGKSTRSNYTNARTYSYVLTKVAFHASKKKIENTIPIRISWSPPPLPPPPPPPPTLR